MQENKNFPNNTAPSKITSCKLDDKKELTVFFMSDNSMKISVNNTFNVLKLQEPKVQHKRRHSCFKGRKKVHKTCR